MRRAGCRPRVEIVPRAGRPGARHTLASVDAGGAKKSRHRDPREAWESTSRPASSRRTFLIERRRTSQVPYDHRGLCRHFAQFRLTRADVVVGVGGGVVTDVAGFAAAVYHRGWPWPTSRPPSWARSTLPSAARRGSTCPRAKTWWAPSGNPLRSICDTEVLSTLPPREYRSGLGEMAKYAFLGVTDLPQSGPGGRRGPLRGVQSPAWSPATSAETDSLPAAVAPGPPRRGPGAPQLRPHLGLMPSRRRATTTSATAKPWP